MIASSLMDIQSMNADPYAVTDDNNPVQSSWTPFLQNLIQGASAVGLNLLANQNGQTVSTAPVGIAVNPNPTRATTLPPTAGVLPPGIFTGLTSTGISSQTLMIGAGLILVVVLVAVSRR